LCLGRGYDQPIEQLETLVVSASAVVYSLCIARPTAGPSMLKRQTTVSIAVLVGGCLIGGASYAWLKNRPSSPDVPHAYRQQVARTPVPGARTVAPVAPLHLALKMSPMSELMQNDQTPSKPGKTGAASHRTRTQALAADTPDVDDNTTQARQAPLDLALPASDHLVAPPVAASPGPGKNSPQQLPAQNKRLLTTTSIAATQQFKSDPSSALFNRDNGLRGFMKQGWVNQRVGFQGGLAIRQERLRQGNNNLGDNMAVGMGVLLAF
jgi:hypothetical protein